MQVAIERLESSHSVDSISDCATVWYANTIHTQVITYTICTCTHTARTGMKKEAVLRSSRRR